MGVLVIVIIVLLVAIAFILYTNYQYQRKSCLKSVDSYEGWSDSSGEPQTRLYQPGKTRQGLYPLYSAYCNSTMNTYPSYSSFSPYTAASLTNHYATTDLMYYKHVEKNTTLSDKSVGKMSPQFSD